MKPLSSAPAGLFQDVKGGGMANMTMIGHLKCAEYWRSVVLWMGSLVELFLKHYLKLFSLAGRAPPSLLPPLC